MEGATGREPRDRGGMAGAQGATVVEVVRAHAGAHIEPVFGILSSVPPVKVTEVVVKVEPGAGVARGGGKVPPLPPPSVWVWYV